MNGVCGTTPIVDVMPYERRDLEHDPEKWKSVSEKIMLRQKDNDGSDSMLLNQTRGLALWISGADDRRCRRRAGRRHEEVCPHAAGVQHAAGGRHAGGGQHAEDARRGEASLPAVVADATRANRNRRPTRSRAASGSRTSTSLGRAIRRSTSNIAGRARSALGHR
ncbi:MAG: hypothetical protein AB7O60_19715 [Variibacter sp.]|uniref:hypothetical protein n=1 Tax=Pseudorhodoplanes sp. TaxID=1934341 RepID=UPI003D0AD78E